MKIKATNNSILLDWATNQTSQKEVKKIEKFPNTSPLGFIPKQFAEKPEIKTPQAPETSSFNYYF